MTSPISVPQLAKLRKTPQWTELYLAGTEIPSTVFAARVNQVFEVPVLADDKPYDEIAEVAYDTVTTGAYTDIVVGMTMFVGTSPGSNDVGIVRIRKAPTSNTLYFGEESDVEWADDLYLTVIDEILLFQRHVKIVGSQVYMDNDIDYSDQHEDCDPVPCMGSDIVLDIEEYPVAVNRTASGSWVFDSTITSYLWTASAGVLTNETTATPTLTISSYPANGKIRLKLTVTAANGKSYSGYRKVHVYDSTHRPHKIFTLENCSGNADVGGWSFEVTMFADASVTQIYDRAKVILFAKDHYGRKESEIESIGQLSGSENIVAIGYIDGETIEWNAEYSAVRFTVQGPQFWFDKMSGFPPGVQIVKGDPNDWTDFHDLTVDKALWHLLHWRTTATMVMDIFLTNDARLSAGFEVPTDSIWQQIIEIAQTSIFAIPLCDRFGRLFVEIDANLTPVIDRSAFPVIMDVDEEDAHGNFSLQRKIIDEVSMLDLSGVTVSQSGTGVPLFALANGHLFKHYGQIEVADRLLLDDQMQANDLAGLAIAKRNNEFPSIPIPLWANNRMIDICPRQYLGITIYSFRNIREVNYVGNAIPREVSHVWNNETGAMPVEIIAESETFPEIAITGDSPVVTDDGDDTPPETPPPPPPPGDIGEEGPQKILLATYDDGLAYTVNAHEGTDASWFLMNNGLSETERNNVVRMLRSPSGAFFIAIGSVATPVAIDSIYYAPSLGSSWVKILDKTQVHQGTYGNAVISGFGINPFASEQLLVIGGGYSALNVGTKKTYLGSSAGFTEIDGDIDCNNEPGDISIEGSKWIFTANRASALTPAGWSDISSAGAIITETNDFTTGFIHQAFCFHHRKAGKIFMLTTNLGAKLRVISDDDPTVEVIYDLPNDFGVDACNVAISPSGLFLMGGNASVIGQRSSDGGASWGNIGTSGGMTTGCEVWGNGGDDNWFIAALTNKIMKTGNWGTDWEDNTGDLSTLLPLFSPRQILVMP